MTEEEILLVAAKSSRELALVEHAFDGLKVAITDEMINTTFEQLEKRERLFVALKTLSMVRQSLEVAITAGETVLSYRNAVAESGITRP